MDRYGNTISWSIPIHGRALTSGRIGDVPRCCRRVGAGFTWASIVVRFLAMTSASCFRQGSQKQGWQDSRCHDVAEPSC